MLQAAPMLLTKKKCISVVKFFSFYVEVDNSLTAASIQVSRCFVNFKRNPYSWESHNVGTIVAIL